MDRPSRFGPASLLLIGFIVGLVIALYYTWVVDPIIYLDAGPARLQDEDKAEYILLVSQSYAATGDWDKALERLEALDDDALDETVADQLEQYLREGRPASVLNNMAVLAAQLGVESPALSVFGLVAGGTATPSPTAVSETATPTQSPTPTNTRLPTRTPAPTATPTIPSAPTAVPDYRLLGQERVCDAAVPVSRIEVEVVDAFLVPLPGVEVIVEWNGGQDHFFTGFKPEFGLGYGDFEMQPEIAYTVYLAGGSPEIGGLRIEACDEGQGGLPGGWRLSFQNTNVSEAQPTPTPEEE
jgi:hypothetical protein